MDFIIECARGWRIGCHGYEHGLGQFGNAGANDGVAFCAGTAPAAPPFYAALSQSCGLHFLSEEFDMAIRFAATINAFNRGIEDIKPANAVSLIEDWETALAEVDVPGAKGIARDLASLRKQLESDTPDGERVSAIVARLGEAVARIAPRAEKVSDKLTDLGEALSDTGTAQDDEKIDEAAAAAPRRKKAA